MHGTINVPGIIGRVLADSDANNAVSGADDGLNGVTVEAYDALEYAQNPGGAAPLVTTTTDSNGRYIFDNPNPAFGYVTIHVPQQPGFGTSPDPPPFPVSSTSVNEDKDVLLTGTGTVSGTVWNDVNGNFSHDSPEVGKSGVTVSLGGKRSTTTDGDGNYSFANAVPGPGTVIVTAPSGFGVVGSASRPINLQNPDYTATGQDFFVQQLPGSISGVVHEDLDGSGTANAGEPGIPHVELGLDNTGDGVADITTTSVSDGSYSFTGLPARAYRVVFNVPAGFQNTGPAAFDVTLAPGGSATNADFFARRPPPAPPAETPPAEQPPAPESPFTIELLGSGKGTSGDDLFNGTGKADRMFGLGGDDLLLGLGGNDLLDGGIGNDSLDGGAGNDNLKGGKGRDGLTGGPGNDKLAGGDGNDRLSGGPGKDQLDGGKGKDSYNAGSGDDTVNSKDGTAETVSCGAGKDKVTADKKDKLKGCETLK
jgi:Ca2+-binding RTX toxin-like protein